MNKVVVISDSTCDLSEELVKKYNIEILPLHVSFPGDEKVYSDGVDLKSLEVYQKVKENGGKLPVTSAINVAEFVDYFKKYIDEGYDIVFTGIGKELSSTYNNARLASEEFEKGRIEIVDSMSLSTGTGLLVLKAAELRDEGRSAHEIAEKLNELAPKLSVKFCINELDYLYKGGRCSGMTKLLGGMLHLHPVAKMGGGKLTVGRVLMGKYIKACKSQVEEFMKDFKENNIYLDHVFVTDSDCMDGEENYIIEELSKVMPKENIHHTHAGCVVSSHCGPKTVGILYILKEENKK